MSRVVITQRDSLIAEVDLSEKDVIAIGRSAANDIVLPDPGRKISRYHAAIIQIPGPKQAHFLRDLGSLSSTRIGGAVVYKSVLADGDIIHIGDYDLLYCQTTVQEGRTWGGELIEVGPIAANDSVSVDCHTDHERSTVLSRNEEFVKEIPQIRGQKEVVEALLERARVVSEVGPLFEELIGPILHVLDAHKGFVGLFREGRANHYYGVGVRGFDPKRGDRIRISDPAFLARLRQRLYLQEHATVLVPVLRGEHTIGFFCVEKKSSKGAFSEDEIKFLDLLGRLAASRVGNEGTEDAVRSQRLDYDTGLPWPTDLVGNSEKMQEVRRQLEHAAASPGNVLLLGESGTGKEVAAQEIHRRSTRSRGPFLPVNCGAFPEGLVESELFGFKKGAFSGANDDKLGLFELANKGTLLLDEIGTMSLAVQAKLLRVLEVKAVLPLGARAALPIDVKVIAATDRNLDQAIKDGQFLETVYYRFEQLIHLPPLRERKEDIPLLAHYFLDQCAQHGATPVKGLSHWAVRHLLEYDWPGNVRVFQHCIEAAVRKSTNSVLFSWELEMNESHSLPPNKGKDIAKKGQEPSPPVEKKLPKNLKQMTREYVMEALEYTKGNKTAAAKLLGYTEATIYNHINKYGIPRHYGVPGAGGQPKQGVADE